MGLLLAKLDLPRPDVSEDAPALAMERDGVGLIGVFDGLGGAGAQRVEGEAGPRTTAYYASRLAREAVADRFGAGDVGRSNGPVVLSDAIGNALSERNRIAPPARGPVRSTMLRAYPTTAALVLVEPVEGAVETLAMWAGDSRCYALTPISGLQQLSLDDTPAGNDPMRALGEDGPMTNLFYAGAPARLRCRAQRIAEPVVFLAASDGAHACWLSPMHFELALLESVVGSACGDDWLRRLADRLGPLADDDVSLAAACADSSLIAAAFVPRLKRIEALIAELGPAPSRSALAQAWSRYRLGYMALTVDQ